MNFQQAVLIYNPVSGRKRNLREKGILVARDALMGSVGSVRVEGTKARGDATRIAAEAVSAGCDLIVACGGDGTVNEVIGGMAGCGVPLLALPAGTANVLAEEVGFPADAAKTAALLPTLVPVKVPLGRVQYEQPQAGSRLFLLMCGVGVDASIVYHLNTKLKEYLGQGAYWLGSLEQLQRKFPPFEIRLNGETYESTFALISKSRRYGGRLILAPDAHVLSGEFQVVIFHGDSPLRYVGYLAQIATQTLHQFEDVSFHHTDRVELLSPTDEKVYIEADGEFVGRLPATVETLPAALTLLLPPEYVERRPRESEAAEAVSGVSRS